MTSTEYAAEIEFVESAVNGIHDLFTHRGTMDAWMHERIMSFLHPIVATLPDADWLTIGDAGSDGWMLKQYGAKSVTASSISDAGLRKAVELGHLTQVAVCALNAERLELDDATFDLLLCSQAYHHVRRPPLAFYEFIRVSRIGFVIVEPLDFPHRPLQLARTLAKIALRRRRPIYDLFEPTGNYVYRVSIREITRMLAAIQLPWFAIKTYNSFYLPWLAIQSRYSRLARGIFALGTGIQDFLCFSRLMSPGVGVIFVPTRSEAPNLRETLRAARFRIVTIPKNPYFSQRIGH